MKKIKPQEEKYLQGLMQGMTQREAYLFAYPEKKNWKLNAIDNRASDLLKRGEIKVRYAELQQEASEANAVTRDSIIKRLKDIAYAPIDFDRLRPADQVRCLELLTKILGFDSPDEDE
jgi:hypothetical protein